MPKIRHVQINQYPVRMSVCVQSVLWTQANYNYYRLRVFGNMVLRGIFGPERDEVTGKWRKL
jgi:hypothetical protein